ncbi:hypothetical protein B0H11DRAFT_2245200 [Mycena galericulata]|nr:hypothetical protein B0H11DRAFT_2245200 [Mycena galericulata]
MNPSPSNSMLAAGGSNAPLSSAEHEIYVPFPTSEHGSQDSLPSHLPPGSHAATGIFSTNPGPTTLSEMDAFVRLQGEEGDIIRSSCSTFDLLGLYTALEEEEDSLRADCAEDDLDTLHPRHYMEEFSRANPRRSSRIASLLNSASTKIPAPPPSLKRAAVPGPTAAPSKRAKSSGPASTGLPSDQQANKKVKKRKSAGVLIPPSIPYSWGQKKFKWVSSNGQLITPQVQWKSSTSSSAVLDWRQKDFTFAPPSPAPSYPDEEAASSISSSKRRRGKGSVHRRAGVNRSKDLDGSDNPAHLEQLKQRLFERSDAISSSSYDLIRDGSTSSTGWQGIAPPKVARSKIRRLYATTPNAVGLHVHLKHFFPVPYRMPPEVEHERATFLVDCNGMIFFFRTYRAVWLEEAIDEVQEMHDVLVGPDIASEALKKEWAKGERGPHFPCIIGHCRQSSKTPHETAWHVQHRDRVDKFLSLKITQRIISWVSRIVKLVFPGVAASFEKEAAALFLKYGIRPLFGYFWNFCLNAILEGQLRIHSFPHADRKNRIGVCCLLIYILKRKQKIRFNHKQRTWLVVWEAGVTVELPPWVLALYPSALFYHFNIDIHQIKFVSTENGERPTRDNSRPIVEGDECGRGSMVFFNQSTMTQSAETGGTIKEAKLSGQSGTTDFGSDAQAAFSKHITFVPFSSM